MGWRLSSRALSVVGLLELSLDLPHSHDHVLPELAERDCVDEGVDGAGEEDSIVPEDTEPERDKHAAQVTHQLDQEGQIAQQEHGAHQEDGQDDGKGGKGGGAAERVAGGYHQHAAVGDHHQDYGENHKEEDGARFVVRVCLAIVL